MGGWYSKRAGPDRTPDGSIREDLAGVEQTLRIERGLDAFHEGDRLGIELERQVLRLGEPDAVFAADRALERHHAFEQGALGVVRAAQLVLVARRDHDVHVDVAVAGVPE